MARIVDTGVLIELERRGRTVDDLLPGSPDEPVFVTSISISELLVGLHRAPPGRRQLQRETFIMEVVKRISVLPFDLQAALVHAEISVQLMKLGQPIGIYDTLIAAIALTHEYTVLTTNPKHFARVPGLVVEQPTWSD